MPIKSHVPCSISIWICTWINAWFIFKKTPCKLCFVQCSWLRQPCIITLWLLVFVDVILLWRHKMTKIYLKICLFDLINIIYERKVVFHSYIDKTNEIQHVELKFKILVFVIYCYWIIAYASEGESNRVNVKL